MRLGRIWCVAAAVVTGTLLGCGCPPSVAPLLVASSGAALVLLRRPAGRVAGLAALAVGLAWLSSGLRCEPDSTLTGLAPRAPGCAFSGRILEQAGGLGTLVALARLQCRGFRPVVAAGVAVLDGSVGMPGSSMSGRGRLLPLGTDDFERARARAGAQATLAPTELELSPPASGPQALASGARRHLETVTRPLAPARAALLRGLVVGDTGGLDRDTLDAFRGAGLSHLLAVSGSNVAIVLGAVGLALRPLALRLRVAAGGLALGLYVLVVGPEPSVLRAALMGAIALVALAAGARADPLAALGSALVVLLALRPALVFSVGLHLSVAATGGIVLWADALAARLRPLPRPIALPLGTSLSAQAAVAPLLIAVFGELSLAAPAANLLAAPAVAPATVLGLAASVVHILNPGAGVFLARLAEPWAAWILWVGESFGTRSWSSLPLSHEVGWLAVAPLAASVWITLRVGSAR